MIRRPKTLIPVLLATIGMAAAVPAGAAETATKSSQANQASSKQAQQSARDMRASQLIGKNVRNAQGESLGEIKDLILDVNNDRVYYAVLEFGGFLGLGEKLFAYPVRAFNVAADRDELILNVPQQRLKDAPGFARDQWPDWGRYGGDVDRYFGATMAVKPSPNQKLVRASELIGEDVEDATGTDVGEIEDIVVNMGNGRIHYAVLDFDQTWGPDDKLLALPMRAFNIVGDREQRLVLNVAKDRLDMARAFDQDKWPNLNDSRYQSDMRRYLDSMQTSGSSGTAATGARSGSTGTGSTGTTGSAGTAGSNAR